jgi:hypothetical protein
MREFAPPPSALETSVWSTHAQEIFMINKYRETVLTKTQKNSPFIYLMLAQ